MLYEVITTNMGSADMVAPAIIGENSVEFANLKVFKPTWTVYIASLFVTRNGQKKVFQLLRNVLIAMTDKIVFEIGSTILANIWSWLAPSIFEFGEKEPDARRHGVDVPGRARDRLRQHAPARVELV